MTKSSYRCAGVDIDAGKAATEMMRAAVQATYGPQVLAGIGAFGGLFSGERLQALDEPILVASTDGVGTKTMVAARLGRWDTIGHDIVNHCVNDILVQGAQPLFFLDYVASSTLDPVQIATVVGGVAAACRENGCALLGGETAEMPGVYQTGAVDLVGTVVGVVDRAQLIDGSRIAAGDTLLALRSSGAHTNGYTLLRALLGEHDWQKPQQQLGGSTIGDLLLTPHRSYLNDVQRLRRAGIDIRGLAHITGGGVIDNLPRILPAGLGALIRRGSWRIPALFDFVQKVGAIDRDEMYRVFNMGIGFVVIVAAQDVPAAQAVLAELQPIGHVVAGAGVMFDG